MAPSPHTRLGNCPLTEDDLWRSVMASGDDGAVVFVVKGGAAEVHHPHGRALHAALVPLLGANREEVTRCTQAKTPPLFSEAPLSLKRATVTSCLLPHVPSLLLQPPPRQSGAAAGVGNNHRTESPHLGKAGRGQGGPPWVRAPGLVSQDTDLSLKKQGTFKRET